jgi:transposase
MNIKREMLYTHRRGTAYPPAIRERVMNLLAEGHSLNKIAEQLCISRLTVLRYKKMARDQGTLVPQPKKMGGYRYSKLNRQQIQWLSEYLVKHPKLTLHELRLHAVQQGILKEPGVPSISTLSQVLKKKGGLHYAKALFRDPKVSSEDSLIAVEKKKFQTAQKKDKIFSISKLLFMDETNITLNMQQQYGWAPKGKKPLLYKPKSKTMTYNMSVIIGINPRTIFWVIKPPERQYDPIPVNFQSYEFAEPGKKIQTGYSTNQIRSLPPQKLKEILKKYGVRNSNAKVAELRDHVTHLQAKGLVGLPRAQRGRDKGGPKKPFRSTIYDVVEFFDDFADLYKKKFSKANLSSKTVILDNASTHSAIRVEDTKHKSIFHRLAKSRWGLKNIIYQPPLSPQLQPVETFNAYLKSRLRHYAPLDGLYTEELLYRTIDKITNQITEQMILNWTVGSGYSRSPNPKYVGREQKRRREEPYHHQNLCSMKEPLFPKHKSIICANENGTIIKQKLRGQTKWHIYQKDVPPSGLKNIQVQVLPPKKKRPQSQKPTRFAGYSRERKDLIETNPESLEGREIGKGLVYEVEGIVDDQKEKNGKVFYRIRWKGYPPAQDTWEVAKNLQFAKEAIREYNKRRKR